MKIIISFLSIVFIQCKNNFVTYCNKNYKKEIAKIHLEDYNMIEAELVQVLSLKTNKPVFGYYVSAMRNDTNFITSSIRIDNNKIIITKHLRYGIDKLLDSTVNVYTCMPKGIYFNSYTEYLSGKKKYVKYFNQYTE